MNNNTTVIDIIAQVTDRTQAGAAGAISTASKLEKAIRKTQAEIERLCGKSKIEITMYAIDKASKILNGVANAGKKIAGKVWKVTLKAVDLVTAPFRGIMTMLANPIVAMAGIAGVSLGIGDLINTYKNFEQGMANLKAITRGTDDDMSKLTATAKRLGEETMFSAQQVAGGMEFLAMAGWKTKDIISGMPGLLDLAAAGGIDVATSADVVSSALAQFNMEAKESARVADVLAAAATNSKTDVRGLGESLKYAGTAAGSMNYDIADVALGLGLMGNVGIDSSMAGTAMRSLISRIGGKDEAEIAGEGDKITKALKKVGVSAYDAKGRAKPFLELMKDLRKGFAGLKEDEIQSVAQDIAGMYGKNGLLAIVNASEEKFNGLASAIENSTGIAKENAKTRMDTLQGSMLYLQSAAEGAKIAFMDRLTPYLRQFIDWLTSRMPDIKNVALELADNIGNTIDKIKKSVRSMIHSPEWQNAETIWGKVKVAWDKLIEEPFSKWWSNKGKAWIAGIAQDIGKGLGNAVKYGISMLLGLDVGGVLDDGVSIGKSFAKGFSKGIEGVDWDRVAKGIGDAMIAALKLAFSNPITGTLAASWIGGNVLGGISSAYNIGKGIWTSLFGTGVQIAGNTVTNGGGLFGGIAQGLAISKAAKAGTPLAQTAFTFAQAGQLGLGAKIGSAGLGGMAVGAAGVAGGIITTVGLIDVTTDLIKAVKTDKKKEAEIHGTSAFLKGSGMVVGAGIGAVVGSVVPVIGTAIGSLVGAGIGYIGGKLMGDNVKKRYEKAETAVLIAKEQAKYADKDLRAAIADTNVTAEEFNQMFQKKVAQGLQRRFGDISLTLTEIQGIAKSLTFSNATEGLNAFAAATAEVDNNLINFQTTALNLKKINWKANLGLEWTENDAIGFKTEAENLLTGAQNLLQNKHYEAAMAIKLILGDDDSSGITEGLNAVYSNLQGQAGELSSQARIILSKDGILSFDEQAEVNNLLEQITKITDMVSNVQNEVELDFLNIKYGGADMDIESFKRLQQELPQFLEGAKSNFDAALKTGLANLKLEYTLNPEFDYDTAAKELTDKYMKNISDIEKRVLDFQMVAIGKAFSNSEFAGELETILPNLEGDLKTRLETALTSALTLSDKKLWDENAWMTLLGLENNSRLADELKTVLDPVADSMTAGFLDRFGMDAPKAADEAQKIFKKDVQDCFGRDISVDTTIKVRANVMTQYVKDKLGGQNASFGDQPAYFPDTQIQLPYVKRNAEGGIFDRYNLKPIGNYTDSNGVMGNAHIGLVGEDGAEAIIPLSGKRHKRGVKIWQIAGQMLGILPKVNNAETFANSIPEHAAGGIFGGQSLRAVSNSGKSMTDMAEQTLRNGKTPIIEPLQTDTAANEATNITPPITVNMGGINIDLHTGNEDVNGKEPNMKETVLDMVDDIAQKIAVTLEQVLANLPVSYGRG